MIPPASDDDPVSAEAKPPTPHIATLTDLVVAKNRGHMAKKRAQDAQEQRQIDSAKQLVNVEAKIKNKTGERPRGEDRALLRESGCETKLKRRDSRRLRSLSSCTALSCEPCVFSYSLKLLLGVDPF